MPNTSGYPRNKEGKQKYISDCIHTMSNEHKDWDNDRRVAACESMWKTHWNEKTSKATNLNIQGYWVIDFFEE